MPHKHRSRPTSPAQLAANRRNAAASTGPQTIEGKKAAARNATKHGILARQLLRFENQEGSLLFSTLWARLMLDYRPLTTVERILVERVAVTYWRLRRTALAESQAIAACRKRQTTDPHTGLPRDCPPQDLAPLPDDYHLQLYTRYETTLEHQLYRALDELERHRQRNARSGRERTASFLAYFNESSPAPAPLPPFPSADPSSPAPAPSEPLPSTWAEAFQLLLGPRLSTSPTPSPLLDSAAAPGSPTPSPLPDSAAAPGSQATSSLPAMEEEPGVSAVPPGNALLPNEPNSHPPPGQRAPPGRPKQAP